MDENRIKYLSLTKHIHGHTCRLKTQITLYVPCLSVWSYKLCCSCSACVFPVIALGADESACEFPMITLGAKSCFFFYRSGNSCLERLSIWSKVTQYRNDRSLITTLSRTFPPPPFFFNKKWTHFSSLLRTVCYSCSPAGLGPGNLQLPRVIDTSRSSQWKQTY